MTMCKALHLRDDVDSMSKKKNKTKQKKKQKKKTCFNDWMDAII